MEEVDSAQLRELEQSLWDSEKRFDAAYMESVFALSFFEHGRSGNIYTRGKVLAGMGIKIEAKLPLEDFKITQLDINTALVTYRNEVTTSSKQVKKSHRCSIWSRIDDKWKIRFHQATITT